MMFRYSTGPVILKDVNFGLDQSSRICIVGPNGAGNSSMVVSIRQGTTRLPPSKLYSCQSLSRGLLKVREHSAIFNLGYAAGYLSCNLTPPLKQMFPLTVSPYPRVNFWPLSIPQCSCKKCCMNWSKILAQHCFSTTPPGRRSTSWRFDSRGTEVAFGQQGELCKPVKKSRVS